MANRALLWASGASVVAFILLRKPASAAAASIAESWPDIWPDISPDPEPSPLPYSHNPVDPAPAPLRYPSNAEREARFGPLHYVAAPTASNPEAVRITNDFARRIVRRDFPLIGPADVHELAAPSLMAALSDIEAAGLGPLVRQFAGSWVPRFVRKSKTSLSSHSYGTSIDVNAADNPQGSPPTADQARLAPYFERRGWYWGDRFTTTRDPMHFEFVGAP